MQSLRLIAIAVFTVASSAHAAQVVNGSLNGTIENNGVPSGWTLLSGSPDIMDANNNVGVANAQYFGAAPTASPDGGTWVGLGRDTALNESFGQMLTGLVVGQQYTVSWVDGNFGYSRGAISYLGANAINVLIDGVSIGSGSNLAVGSSWSSEALTFTATSTSQQLAFQLTTPTKAYMSIDGIAVAATQAVPEPGTWVLMGLGMAGMGMVMRKRQAV